MHTPGYPGTQIRRARKQHRVPGVLIPGTCTWYPPAGTSVPGYRIRVVKFGPGTVVFGVLHRVRTASSIYYAGTRGSWALLEIPTGYDNCTRNGTQY
eukprot:699338-Rhodomonas_salina.2